MSDQSMTHYKRMTIFQNVESVRSLKTFKKLGQRYFDNVDYGSYGLTVEEKPKAKSIRSQVNLMMEKAKRALSSVEVGPRILDASRPTADEHEEGVYLIENIFNLHQLKISPQTLFDYIERAIGAYRDDRLRSLIRTLNPLFWLGIVLDSMSRFPFAILGALGFNPDRIEGSFFGRFLKGCLRIAIVVTVAAAVLYYQGYLDPMDQTAQGLLSELKRKGLELIAYLQDSSRPEIIGEQGM